MAVGLAQAIQVLKPTAETPRDFIVTQDKKGVQTILFWNTASLGVQPTAAALAAVTPAQVAAMRVKKMDMGTRAAIATLATHPDPAMRALYEFVTTGTLSAVNDTRGRIAGNPPPLTAAAVTQAVTAKLDAKIASE